MRYTLGEQQARKIFTSRYQLHLPAVEDLENEIRREVRLLSGVASQTTVKRQERKPEKKIKPGRQTTK